ncbi:hypothetical protein [Ascidiimonas sp. W6]|uniref:hypothetical protein n=1 Tax=Ascidiimonas meishanensis TaxID=3128903 RepID=UPI0030ED0998
MEDQNQEINLDELNEVQREGITRYELTREQVTGRNFGQHILNGMRTLQRQDRTLANQDAFRMLNGLNTVQVNGITQYNLTRNQVETRNFGNHTLNGILNLRLQNVPVNQAFDRVSGLENIVQVRGVTEYNLTQQDVQSENFGEHTLTGLDAIQAQNQGANINQAQAFAMLRGLNQPQVLGITTYGLTPAQIQTENFGMHTLMGMDTLMQQDQQLLAPHAFNRVRNLNPAQAIGVSHLGLTSEQVNTPNFGNHTIDTINSLMARRRVANVQEGFEMVSGLNNRQTTGIRRGLEREDVTVPNFDIHTLFGIEYLQTNAAQNGNEDLPYRDAFQTVSGLNAVQVRGITDLELSRDQVLNPRFGNDTIKTINRLQMINPEANNQYLYEAAMGLPEYQVRGLTKLGLSAEQVGLTVVDTEFVQLNPEDQTVASGRTIDAIDHLTSTEFMSVQEAYETAMLLNRNQIIAMTEFGLSLQQVEGSYFEETADVLNELTAPLLRSGSELTIPLSEEEKQSLRDEISRSGSVQSLSQSYQEASVEEEKQEASVRSDISATEATILPYAAAASLPQQNETRNSPLDLNAFTRIMSLNSITERSSESSNGYPSDEERKKPAVKKGKDFKKGPKR